MTPGDDVVRGLINRVATLPKRVLTHKINAFYQMFQFATLTSYNLQTNQNKQKTIILLLAMGAIFSVFRVSLLLIFFTNNSREGCGEAIKGRNYLLMDPYSRQWLNKTGKQKKKKLKQIYTKSFSSGFSQLQSYNSTMLFTSTHIPAQNTEERFQDGRIDVNKAQQQ